MNKRQKCDRYSVHRRGNLVDELFGSAGRLEVKGEFEEIINLELVSGRGIALAARDFPLAPYHVNLAGFSLLPSLQERQVLLLGSRLIIAGEEIINLQEGELWSGRLRDYFSVKKEAESGEIFARLASLADFPQFSSIQEHHLLELVVENLRSQLRGCGTIFASGCDWRELLPGEVPGGREESELELFVDTLKDFWVREHQQRSLLQLWSLVGAGRGLTPAGDDFLVGLLSALYLSDSELLASTSDFLLSGFASRTTSVSSMALRAALRGYFNEQILNFYEELKTGTEAGLLSALRELEAVGSSSGLDILSGIFMGYTLLAAE